MDRQYIGARYVPKFADPIEWQDGMSYEALTIVTYMGASYTSKKAVPVGVKPTDNRYWVVTGNYNAQVEEYRQTALGTKVEFDKKFNRKWLFLGDSYAEFGGWVVKLVDMLGLNTSDYWNLAVGGDGFYNNLWINRLKDWVANNPDEVKNIGHIVVAGGFNDSRPEVYSQLTDHISAFGLYCKNTFDDAVVQLSYIGWGLDTGTFATDLVTGQYRAGARYAYANCERYYMEYLAGCECVLHARWRLGDDGFHPNDTGGWYIAQALCNAIKTGNGAVNLPLSLTEFAAMQGTGSGHIYQVLSGTTVSTEVYLTFVELNTTFVGNTPTPIASIKLPYSNKFPRTETFVNVQTIEGNAQTERVAFHVDKDVLYMTLLSVEDNNWKTVNVKDIWLFSFSTTHDALTD